LGQYSFIVIGIAGVAVAAVIIWNRPQIPPLLKVLIIGATALAFLVLWLIVRPTDTIDLKSVADADRLIGHGKPAVLEFFSEY
jgi:hypothetical protein